MTNRGKAPRNPGDGGEVKLYDTMDAQVWAKEFLRINSERLAHLDESDMIGWFANAIMCGWDHAHWRHLGRPDSVGPDFESAGYYVSEWSRLPAPCELINQDLAITKITGPDIYRRECKHNWENMSAGTMTWTECRYCGINK